MEGTKLDYEKLAALWQTTLEECVQQFEMIVRMVSILSEQVYLFVIGLQKEVKRGLQVLN